MEEQNNGASSVEVLNDGGHFNREEEIRKLEEKLRTEKQLKSGYTWFYWIAGLSLLNTLAYAFGIEISFAIGLGITQVADGLTSEIGGMVRIIGLLFNLFITGVFISFGLLAKKKRSWAFILGMLIYVLDGVIFVLLREMFGAVFHVLVLLGLYQGFRALRKMGKIED